VGAWQPCALLKKEADLVGHDQNRDLLSFQGLGVICEEIYLPIGAIRAHFKPVKTVILLRNPRKSGFLKKQAPKFPVSGTKFIPGKISNGVFYQSGHKSG